jgi:hypothetical protein
MKKLTILSYLLCKQSDESLQLPEMDSYIRLANPRSQS